MPTWVLKMSVATTGLPSQMIYGGRPTSKSKPAVPQHETDTGSTAVWLEEGEQVYVKWPPDITIKRFGPKGTPDCWDKLKAMAEAQGVIVSLRTTDRRAKRKPKETLPAGERPVKSDQHFASLRIIGPRGTTRDIYEKMRNVIIAQTGTKVGLAHPRQIELLEKSFGDDLWRQPSTGHSCTLARVETVIDADDDDSPDEDEASTVDDSRPQAQPTEASPVGGVAAGRRSETPRSSGSYPPTFPQCTQEQSEKFLKGYTGFCEYAKWRLEVDTQICDFVLRLLLLVCLSRRGIYNRSPMSCP